jgi:AcrR family transcriptional regulator
MRIPQRRRGKLRVAALLGAAAAVFAEKGYEAATMAEVAARAGAPIGSLYQFFPSKDLLAAALRAQYGDTLCQRLADLRDPAASWSVDELAGGLFDGLLEFLAEHPAFMALVEARLAKSAELRSRLRAQVQEILMRQAPRLPPEHLHSVAVAVWQVMKSAAVVSAEADLPERRAVLGELRAMLQTYLRTRLTRG